MQIRVFKSATHIELTAATRCVTQPEPFPLLELASGTPSGPQAVAFALLDTLAVFLRETTLRTALVEVIAPSRNLWMLEHIDIWNYAIEKGMIGTKIAYVVPASTVDRELIFAENYAGNRGIVLKFFKARSEALPWLLNQHVPHASARDSGTAATFGPAAAERSSAEQFAS